MKQLSEFTSRHRITLTIVLVAALLTPAAMTQAVGAEDKAAAIAPTYANVHYGPDKSQVLDFYQAKSSRPTPVVFHIHGGGWQGGDKVEWETEVAKFFAAGISVASINYRFLSQANAAGAKPPVEWPLHDAARALQFVRSKAAEWNIDKKRFGASGGSAGGCTALWLAFHKDLADPKSNDPVARESTRLWCVSVHIPQTSLDPKQMKEWTPNSVYGGEAFGFPTFAAFLAGRDRILPWIKEYSPYELVTADAPPVYMIYATPPALGKDQKDPTHTANFGVKLQEKMHSLGVECEVDYAGAPNVTHSGFVSFLLDKLKKPSPKTPQ